MRRPLLALAVCAGLLALGAAACRSTGLDSLAPSRGPSAAVLYERHCALCHGTTGAGDGPAAELLHPPARDFGRGLFRLVGTTNGIPSEEDLVRTLARGMPGSAMPAWDWMPGADLVALARHVRSLARAGLTERLRAGDPASDVEIAARVGAFLEPGPPLAPVPVAEPGRAVLAEGRALYSAHCAACHGIDGRGMAGAPKRHEDGSLTWARDFTRGVFKGGGSPRAVADRIRAGMPGSSMPALDLEPYDTAALVAYVIGLSGEERNEDRGRLVRHRLVARRLEAPVPTEEDDPRWSAASATEVALAPLAWSDASLLALEVRAVHDAESLAVRLEWTDASRDDRALGGAPFVDAAAIQLTDSESPALMGMGSDDQPTFVWHWRAVAPEDLAGLTDLLDRTPHVGLDDATVNVPVLAGEAGTFRAAGMTRLADRLDRAGAVEARGEWREGRWSLVLVGPLDAAGHGALGPGGNLQVAFALWNGSAGDHGGHKSFSVWSTLLLEE